MLPNFVALPVILSALLISSLSSGCASLSNRSSGFLDSYAHLKPDSSDSRRLVYERVGWKEVNYTSVLIEPTAVRLSTEDQKKVTPKEISDLAAYSEAALRKALETKFQLVADAKPGTLRVRSALTGVDPSSPTVNVLTGIVFWPVDNGGVSMEYDVRDTVSAEQVAALVGFSNGTPLQVFSSFSRFGHARGGIDYWSAELRKLIQPKASGTAPTSRSD